jgi:hypothetical protein
MSPLDVLFWALAALAVLIVLSVIAVLVVVVYAASVGLQRMRDDEDEEIFKGRAEK